MTGTLYSNDTPDAGNGAFSADLTSLEPGTTYYYRAVMQVGDKDYYGEVKSFMTLQESAGGNTPSWLEMPAAKSGSGYYSESLGRGTSRNYSYLYDSVHYGELWCAYPLTNAHTSGSANSSWSYNPNVPSSVQIDVKSSSYSSNYNANYSRGHIIPNADRKSDSNMNKQVYYLTNQVPQIQNSFNDGVWGNLENAVRALATQTDTVYVVTGVCYQTAGGNETIKTLTAASSDIKPSSISVPNYFYKVLLKVKRSGSTVTSASAIGFWFENKAYSNATYSDAQFVKSVDQIEALTGLNFFVNLPSSLESSAEANTSWSSFQNF